MKLMMTIRVTSLWARTSGGNGEQLPRLFTKKLGVEDDQMASFDLYDPKVGSLTEPWPLIQFIDHNGIYTRRPDLFKLAPDLDLQMPVYEYLKVENRIPNVAEDFDNVIFVGLRGVPEILAQHDLPPIKRLR